jgi:hypothetical protein
MDTCNCISPPLKAAMSISDYNAYINDPTGFKSALASALGVYPNQIDILTTNKNTNLVQFAVKPTKGANFTASELERLQNVLDDPKNIVLPEKYGTVLTLAYVPQPTNRPLSEQSPFAYIIYFTHL